MKMLRRMLNETIVGALVYAVTCRLTEGGHHPREESDGRPWQRAGNHQGR
jgi:hypothetical protein